MWKGGMYVPPFVVSELFIRKPLNMNRIVLNENTLIKLIREATEAALADGQACSAAIDSVLENSIWVDFYGLGWQYKNAKVVLENNYNLVEVVFNWNYDYHEGDRGDYYTPPSPPAITVRKEDFRFKSVSYFSESDNKLHSVPVYIINKKTINFLTERLAEWIEHEYHAGAFNVYED